MKKIHAKLILTIILLAFLCLGVSFAESSGTVNDANDIYALGKPTPQPTIILNEDQKQQKINELKLDIDQRIGIVYEELYLHDNHFIEIDRKIMKVRLIIFQAIKKEFSKANPDTDLILQMYDFERKIHNSVSPEHLVILLDDLDKGMDVIAARDKYERGIREAGQ
ncbi:MAG TPA: hypothetical protein PLZ84_03400 [Clostridia bacterium]|nr:hypothetical protein [Clostridia bacterium]